MKDRIKELADAVGVELKEGPMPMKCGTKENVVAGHSQWLGQRFPVTLYGPSWLWLLYNAEDILAFMEDNVDSISWEK